MYVADPDACEEHLAIYTMKPHEVPAALSEYSQRLCATLTQANSCPNPLKHSFALGCNIEYVKMTNEKLNSLYRSTLNALVDPKNQTAFLDATEEQIQIIKAQELNARLTLKPLLEGLHISLAQTKCNRLEKTLDHYITMLGESPSIKTLLGIQKNISDTLVRENYQMIVEHDSPALNMLHQKHASALVAIRDLQEQTNQLIASASREAEESKS